MTRPPRRASEASADAAVRLELAHALRTPLTSLVLGVGVLDDGRLGALNAAQRDVVKMLVEELARLQLVVDRALQTDRLGAYAGPIERAEAELADLVRAALAPLGAQARERDVRLDLRLAAALRARVDPVKVSWVVASLVGNALRYSPAGGTVRVTLARRDDAAEITVADEGPGVPPDVRARLFDRAAGPSWTLVLVREIAEAHGGAVQLDAGPERGARFLLTLPAVAAAPAPRQRTRRRR